MFGLSTARIYSFGIVSTTCETKSSLLPCLLNINEGRNLTMKIYWEYFSTLLREDIVGIFNTRPASAWGYCILLYDLYLSCLWLFCFIQYYWLHTVHTIQNILPCIMLYWVHLLSTCISGFGKLKTVFSVFRINLCSIPLKFNFKCCLRKMFKLDIWWWLTGFINFVSWNIKYPSLFKMTNC